MKVDAPASKTGLDELFSPGRVLLTLGLLIFVSYPGLILGTQAFCYRDSGLFSYPVAYFLRDTVRSGHWPLWNSYTHCGTPFLAQWNTLALYPFSLIYILGPMPWALNIFLLGDLLLGGLGMYYLAEYWFDSRFAACVAGLVYGWNGLTIHCLMWPCHTAGLAWVPWVVWLCARASAEGGKQIWWAALAAGCQLLTGSPEGILLTWVVVGANLVVGRISSHPSHPGPISPMAKRAGRTLAVALAAAALSAAQLLPWFQLLSNGDRTAAAGSGFWSLPPWGLANFFVPLFHTSPSLSGVFMQDEQQWTSSYYVGVLALALAAVAVWRARSGRVVLLAALALAGVLLALGDAGWSLSLLKRVLPLLGFIRFPIKFIILTVFCFALLAGAGAGWLQKQPSGVVRRSLLGPGIIIGLTILFLLAVAHGFPFPGDVGSAIWLNGAGRLAFLAAGLVLFALLVKNRSSAARAFLAFGFLIWMGLDINTHEPQQNPSVPARAYDRLPPPMTSAPRLGESRAMLSPQAEATLDSLVNADLLQLYTGQRAELFSDCNLLDGIPKVGGFISLHPAREHKVEGLLREGKAALGLAQFLGVSQIASPTNLFTWDAQSNYLPWATIGQKPIFLSDEAALGRLSNTSFSPQKDVLLALEAQGQVQAGADPGAQIISSHFGVSECVFQTSAQARTMLVVAQTDYPGWCASVDGAPVTLWRANYAFQAVEIPPGRHEVRLVYTDRMFQAGGGISILAILVCMAQVSRRWPGDREKMD